MIETGTPLVSVLMGVYNEERFVRLALESLLVQTYRNIEYVICDNCSTDGTWAIVQEYAGNDSRIKTFRQAANIGALENFNTALGLSTGEYVMYAAGHDFYAPRFVEACVREMQTDSRIVMAYPRAEFMDVQGQVLGRCATNFDTRGMTPAARASVVLWGIDYPYQMYGLFHRSMYVGWQFRPILVPDVLFLLQAALKGTFAQVPEVLLRMRRNDDYGDSEAYARKIFAAGFGDAEGRGPDHLYYEMLREYIRVVTDGHPPGTARNSLVATVVLAMGVRHHCQLEFARQVAGRPPAPAKSDLQSVVDRFAGEMEHLLQTRGDIEDMLRRQARHDVLRQFSTDELVSLMSFAELGRGVWARVKRKLFSAQGPKHGKA